MEGKENASVVNGIEEVPEGDKIGRNEPDSLGQSPQSETPLMQVKNVSEYEGVDPESKSREEEMDCMMKKVHALSHFRPFP